MPRELTVREVAERERVTRRTVYNWIEKGILQARKPHDRGQLRIIDPRPPVKTTENR
jgi:excisionase family DNA binding protein